MSEREAYTPARELFGDLHCHKRGRRWITWFMTGRACGGEHASCVREHIRAEDLGETDMECVRQAHVRGAGDMKRWNFQEKTRPERITHDTKPRRVGCELIFGELTCMAESHDGGDVGSTSSPTSLVACTEHLSLPIDAISHIERTDALWSIELVSNKRVEVDLITLYIDRDLPHSLCAIDMKQGTLFATQRAELWNGLNRADLIVGVHHTHEQGVRVNGLTSLLEVDLTQFVDAEPAHIKITIAEHLDDLARRGMLDDRTHELTP